MNMSISRRARLTPSSPIRKLQGLANSAERRGITVYHLNIGQPDFPTPRQFFEEMKKYDHGTLSYAPSKGYHHVILAWQSYYRSLGIRLKEEDLMLTTGGSEAILFALLSVTDPGDRVVVFEPLYTNYLAFARIAGVTLTPVTLHAANGFHLPPAREIEKTITHRTKAIILCNPSNPTGTVFGRLELQTIVRLARRHNLFIITDETYREIVFQGQRAVSLMSFPALRDKVILVDSVSKRFNLCGARIGCLASRNERVMESAEKFAQSRLSSPSLGQLAVIPLLKNASRFVKPVVREYHKRRDAVVRELQKMRGIQWYCPEGAFYIITALPVRDAEHFCRWLLTSFHVDGETVMLAPATGFYVTANKGKNEVRIAFVLSIKRIKRAMEILRQGLDTYKRIYGPPEKN